MSSKKAIVTFGNSGGGVSSPEELMGQKIIRVNEIETTSPPLTKDGEKPISMWYLNGSSFTTPIGGSVEFTIPANSTVKKYTEINNIKGTIKKVNHASGTRGLLTSAMASLFKTGVTFNHTEVSSTKYLRTTRLPVTNSTYFIQLVEVDANGEETILQNFNTSIVGFSSTYNYRTYQKLIPLGNNKFVFVGVNNQSGNDYAGMKVITVDPVANTITGGSIYSMRLDEGSGQVNTMISVSPTMIIGKGDTSYTRSWYVNGNVITAKSSYNNSSLNYWKKISENYFVGRYDNDTFYIFYVNPTTGGFTSKLSFNISGTMSYFPIVLDNNKFMYVVNDSATGRLHGKIYNYDGNTTVTEILDKEIDEKSYSTGNGGVMLDNDVAVITAGEESGVAFIKNITFNTGKTDFTVEEDTREKVAGYTSFVIEKYLDYVDFVYSSNMKVEKIEIVNNILDIPQVKVIKKVNGRVFEEISDLKELDFNEDYLTFEFEFINEKDTEIVIPYSTSVYLYLVIIN